MTWNDFKESLLRFANPWRATNPETVDAPAPAGQVRRFDRDRFFQSYRQTFGSLTQSQVSGLNFLLDSFEAQPEWRDRRHISYALATIRHETARTYQPIEERGSASYFSRYDGNRALGNTRSGDGARFKGRGYVQITGRRNYTYFSSRLRADLINHPEATLVPLTAFAIMTIGMHEGRFTGRKLSDYINMGAVDFVNARRVINGLDSAQVIAAYAHTFDSILRMSEVKE